MNYFRYTMLDHTPHVIQAPTLALARLLLQEKNIFPIKIKRLRYQFTLEKQMQFLEELHTLLTSGISLINSLTLMQQSHLEFIPTLQPLILALQEGKTLQAELNNQGLDKTCCELIAIGEKTGRLEHTLHQAHTLLKKRLHLIKTFKKSLVYPGIVFISSLILMSILLLCVVPQFEQFFKEFNSSLPWITRWMIAGSHSLKNNLPHLLLVFIVATLLLKKTKTRWQNYLKKISVHLPLLRGLMRDYLLALLFTQLAHYLSSGISLQQTLAHLQTQKHHPRIQNLLSQWQYGLQQGHTLAHLMQNTPWMTAKITQMTQIAETCAQLDTLFSRLCAFYEEKVSENLSKLMQWIEPSIMIMLGLSIGTLIIAMYLPIFYLGYAL